MSKLLTRFCNINYAREIAIIVKYTADSKRGNVGVGRLKSTFGIILKDNTNMISLCKKMGFNVKPYSSDEMLATLEF